MTCIFTRPTSGLPFFPTCAASSQLDANNCRSGYQSAGFEIPIPGSVSGNCAALRIAGRMLEEARFGQSAMASQVVGDLVQVPGILVHDRGDHEVQRPHALLLRVV